MKWPLGRVNLSFWDRLKVAGFIMNPANQLTQGKQVEIFERKMAQKVGVNYAIFVGNGSLANTLLAMYMRDHFDEDHPERNEVILPALTWQTSCSPWIREGFRPVFLDISNDDWSIDQKALSAYLEKNHKKVAVIFPTSLLGFSPDMAFYQNLQKKYSGIRIMFDNCENNFGEFDGKNISSYFTSTTSTYVGHQISSIEGGFIFTDSEVEDRYFRMARNHGMVRGLDSADSRQLYSNPKVDPRFDFYCLGSNFRNTETNALIGSLDIKNFSKYLKHRRDIYCFYLSEMKKFDSSQHIFDRNSMPNLARVGCFDAPFCLPIICHDIRNKNSLIKSFEKAGIETRPIISGFLGNQTAYEKFFKKSKRKYPNAQYLDKYGFYIGLHSGVNRSMVTKLMRIIEKTDLELI